MCQEKETLFSGARVQVKSEPSETGNVGVAKPFCAEFDGGTQCFCYSSKIELFKNTEQNRTEERVEDMGDLCFDYCVLGPWSCDITMLCSELEDGKKENYCQSFAKSDIDWYHHNDQIVD